MPPLPPANNVFLFVAQGLNQGHPFLWRLHFQFSGGTPTNGDCSNIANTLANSFGTHLGPFTPSYVNYNTWTLTDLTSPSSATAVSGHVVIGGQGSDPTPALTAFRIEFHVSRRYRGGHGGVYLPGFTASNLPNSQSWTTATVSGATNGFVSFITDATSATSGSITVNQHVVVSYYHGFTNATSSTGRAYTKPTLRPTPVIDVVSSYQGEQIPSSQRRRGQR